MKSYEDNDASYDAADSGTIRSVSIINLILGAWLIVSPYILGYTSSGAKWNQTIMGIVVLVLAGLRALAPRQQWLSFLNGLAAIWLIIAPWALGYQASAAYWNEVIVGIVVGCLAFWNSAMHISTGGRAHFSGA